jgi:hypothetical protein
MNTKEVLLFNTAADAHLAARLHAATCPMVNTAAKRGRKSVKLIDEDVQENVDDLNERGFTVKRCKCLGAV